jgi:hypothetical protein
MGNGKHLLKGVRTTKYQELLAQTFKLNSGRHGFIDFQKVQKAFATEFKVLDKAEYFVHDCNHTEAWHAVSAVVEAIQKVMGAIDDSGGEVIDAIDRSFGVIDSLIEDQLVNTDLKIQIFDWLKTKYSRDVYHNYYGDFSILEAMKILASQLGRTDEVLALLDSEIKRVTVDHQLLLLLKSKAELLDKFRKQYNRRPAMIEVL